ncbi:MAG TPA: M56 family metallopeptidase [Candidatus Sulfopaludibacter sp.]|nr:M56 family metallopeptidase [Candidatus Sulfopaludibacter sp.]
MLNSLWQIPAIAAVAWLAARMMRNGPANHRHAVWVAALFAAVLLPLASVSTSEHIATQPFSAPAAPPVARSANLPASTSTGHAPVSPEPRTISYAQTTATLLAAAYLFFLLFRVAKLAWAWARTVQIRDAAGLTAAPLQVRQVWDRCMEAFGLRDVELLSSATVPSPAAAGAWRRSIILPESLFAGSSEEVLTTAIGHEMAHLARHDFALKVVYELLSMPVAFHPACWLILRGIEETREMACDELVTNKLLAPEVYARSIVSIASTMSAIPRPGYSLGVFDGDILEQRIRRLLHRPAANLKRARLLLAGGLSALALCVVISSGVALRAQAQNGGKADLDARIQTAKTLMNQAMSKPNDAETLAQVRQALLDILAIDPANEDALSGMLTVSMMAKQPLEGRQWALKMVSLYPKEKTSYYCVGFADWSIIYPRVQAVRTAAGMKPQDTNFIADAAARANLRAELGPMLDEGMQMLDRALQMDPQYSDAAAYMNLLYRMKANIVESPEESKAAVTLADDWVGKALAAKRLAPVSPSGSWTQAPPPPPPPPPPPIPDAALASETPLPAGRNYRENPGLSWQVVAGHTMTAKALIAQLKSEGFPAGAAMTASDHEVRVLVGPFSTEEPRAAARTRLESLGYRVLRAW